MREEDFADDEVEEEQEDDDDEEEECLCLDVTSCEVEGP